MLKIVIITLQMNCTLTSFKTTGGARHPLGAMDATPMASMLTVSILSLQISQYYQANKIHSKLTNKKSKI